MDVNILEEVLIERERQDNLWGQQDHDPFKWTTILLEEVGEVAKAALEASDSKYGSNTLDDYRAELIQVAAVAVSAIESLDRQGGR